ncbi:alpha/beta hydrolase [soil metagenome]
MNNYSQVPLKAEKLILNGSNIYYEVYGKGEPLLLLHGYTWSSKSWLPYISDFADEYKVYLVDLKGHGKSGIFTEKISLRSAASDIDALSRYLKLENINAIGYSYGGEVLFQLALLHPGLIKSMISIGSCGSWSSKDFPDVAEYLSYKNIQNLPWIQEQQTSEEQIKLILDQIMFYDITISEEEMKSIQTKTLIVVGDQDEAISYECVLSAKKNLPNSFLWIVPNTGHGAHRDKNKNEFIKTSKQFFSRSWTR